MIHYLTIACALCLLAAGAARADSFSIVNRAGVTLKVQSKAVKFSPGSDVENHFFDLAPDGQRSVDFGGDFRLLMLHLYNKADEKQNFLYDVVPTKTDPNRKWLVMVKMGKDNLDVKMAEQ